TKEAIATITVVQSGFLHTGSTSTDRAFHTATLLGNNKVLIVGGCEEDYQTGCTPKSSAEVFDPSAGSFSPTGGVDVSRASPTATLRPDSKVLADSTVLIAGGSRDDSAELYDPASGTFTATGNMTAIRHSHTATLLPGGKVLLTGGADHSGAPLASAELYDVSTGI